MSILDRIKKKWIPSPDEQFAIWYKQFGRDYPEGLQ